MNKSCKHNGIRYDPRIKLLQVLIIGILAFTSSTFFIGVCIWNDKWNLQNLF